MKNLLVIAYYFPPYGGGGTQRLIGLCKNIMNFSWKPIVITRTDAIKSGPYDPKDYSLLNEIPIHSPFILVS